MPLNHREIGHLGGSKNQSKNKPVPEQETLPEYDLRGKKGVRGKYYRAYRQGHTVRIYQDDGTVSVQHFTLEDGAIMLEPDVRQDPSNHNSPNPQAGAVDNVLERVAWLWSR